MLSPEQFQSHQAAAQQWARDQRQSGLDVVSRPGLAVLRLPGGDMTMPSVGPKEIVAPGVGLFGNTQDGWLTGDFRTLFRNTRVTDEAGRSHAVRGVSFHSDDDGAAPPTMAWTSFDADPGVLDANEDLPWSMTLHHGTDTRGSRIVEGVDKWTPYHNLHTDNPDEFHSYVERVQRSSGRPDPSVAFDPQIAHDLRKSSVVGLMSEHSNGPSDPDDHEYNYPARVVLGLHPDSGDIVPLELRNAE